MSAAGAGLDPHTPPGWDYNPGLYSQRFPIIALALIATGIAAYLAAYQYRLIDSVWEPFFGQGSETILDSPLSWVLDPVSDATLGAAAYLADAVLALVGGSARWRTMPWLVIFFGVLIGPVGLVGILLVIAQPVLYGQWCTLCLVTAFISILMIGPAMDEVLATLQHLRRQVNSGSTTLWRAFWGLSPRPPQAGAIDWSGGGRGN